MTLPDFDGAYRGEAVLDGVEGVPWNIGEPQPAIAELIAGGDVTSPVLDAGCGVGETALALAADDYRAVGLDSSPSAIERARSEADRRGLAAEFAVADITAFDGYDGRFATVVDSTLFHSLPVAARPDYLRAIARAARPGAVLHVLVFDERLPWPVEARPNGVGEAELRTAVRPFWDVDTITPSTIRAFVPGGMADLATDEKGRTMMPAFLLRAHLPA